MGKVPLEKQISRACFQKGPLQRSIAVAGCLPFGVPLTSDRVDWPEQVQEIVVYQNGAAPKSDERPGAQGMSVPFLEGTPFRCSKGPKGKRLFWGYPEYFDTF